MDSAGNLFVADSGNQRVRRVDFATGVIRTIAGNGVDGAGGDGGPANLAEVDGPSFLAFGASGALLVSDFDQPNGLSLSQDESQLYINDTPNAHIRAFDVAADGSLTGGDVWADVAGDGEGNTDGLTFDSAGNLFTTGPAGIHVFAPDATSLGVIHVPEGAANFTWGDDDLQTLYITASTSLYRTRVKVPGRTLVS